MRMMLWHNPLVVRGVRSRLRLPLAASWALVTIVASVFLYIGVSANAIKHGNATPQEAAREAIPALLMLQGVILMVMGSGAVAGGMARERTYRLLDYQRLTPMSPSAKIIGMLAGLPIREYFMFAVSLPFVFYAAWVGGLAFGVLGQFYLVFLCSTLVYHMTGLVAGMVVDKPWRAGTVSQGLVVLLYFALPQISNIGFTFFEHLTARPVFYGLLQQHLLPDGLAGAVQGVLIDPRYKRVAFFGMRLSPTVFSLIVQSFALLSLYVIVHRKWQGETRIPFSKGYALLFFSVAQLFLVGSVQPFLRDERLFELLAGADNAYAMSSRPSTFPVFAVLLATFLVSGVVAALVLHLTTPTYHQSVLGLRRARRRGVGRLPWADDAATSLPLAVVFTLISWLGILAVYQTAVSAGRITVTNAPGELGLLLLFFAVVLVTVQQVREQFVERVFVMALFVFWLVPFLTMIIMWSAFSRPVSGLYVAIPFPAAGFWVGVAMLVSDFKGIADAEMMLLDQASHAHRIVVISVMLYTAAGLVLLLRAKWRWSRISGAAGPLPKPTTDNRPSEDRAGALAPLPVYAQKADRLNG